MVVNLECIKAIVTAEANEGLPSELPFEFQVLEIALEVVCTYLESGVADLERDAYPVLDERASNVSTKNLERLTEPTPPNKASFADNMPGLVTPVAHDLVTGTFGHWLIGLFWIWEYAVLLMSDVASFLNSI
ncbi:magnesium transporter MRS2-4 [Tanacetum coccineum]